MKTAVHALLWELVWKNRAVFLVLAILLAFGAGVACALAHAAPEAWWISTARNAIGTAFLISLLFGFAPFTLMESNNGWRMNSMTTRWFVLPVPIRWLVLAPFLTACVFMVLFMSAWAPILHRLGGFDSNYFMLVLVFGVAGTQTLSWMLARKPSQFWPITGVFFLFILLLGIVPQDTPHWATEAAGMYWIVGAFIPAFALGAWFIARRNRCGDWAGELPLAWVASLVKRNGRSMRNLRSPMAALFWWDTMGAVRGYLATWLAAALLLIGSQCLPFVLGHTRIAFSAKWLVLVALHALPLLAVFWLAVSGLFLGCEPGGGFRSRLSSFRAAWPVSAGTFAAQRIVTALGVWLVTWLPLLVLVPWYDADLSGTHSPEAARSMFVSMIHLMAISAYLQIGALPLLLWGRLEGFPNLLLFNIITWIGPWLILTNMTTESPAPEIRWGFVLSLLAVKLATTGWALAYSWRAGYITWRFATGLVGGWLAVVGALLSAQVMSQTNGSFHALAVVLLMPLARLACCPLAVALNRHR